MNTSATDQARAFSLPEVAFMTGVPLLWAVLLLFHPAGEADAIYRNLQDHVTAGLVVHIGTMLFIPLMAVVVYLLLRGVEGTAARVSRIALVPFVVFYSAWETLQGTANSILADEVNGLPRKVALPCEAASLSECRFARRGAARRAYGCTRLAVPSESAGSDPRVGRTTAGPEPQREDLRCRQ